MRAAAPSILCALGLAATAAGCGPSAVGDDDDGTDAAVSPDARFDPNSDGNDGTGCEKMDILFVVDNSGSMGQEQDNLATNFPGFISVIESSGLDYRVAITTTGVDYTYYQSTIPGGPTLPISQDGGDNGAMLQRCDMTRRWVEPIDPSPAATFACAAAVGTGGPSDEMPLTAMRMALEARVADGTNAGWRRQDALLAIVMLTDENDCSYRDPVTLSFGESFCEAQTEPVANYVGFLDGYTGDRGRWATAVIAGDVSGGCSSGFGGAEYAARLRQFVDLTGTNAVMSSICAGDLTVGLSAALALFDSACQNFPPID